MPREELLMDHPEPARPASFPGPPVPRERDRPEPARPGKPCRQELEEANAENAQLRKELEVKNAENARLEARVAELEGQLGRPYPGPPAGPLRPYPPEGPWGKKPAGPRFGP